jgi:hypothetical protein
MPLTSALLRNRTISFIKMQIMTIPFTIMWIVEVGDFDNKNGVMLQYAYPIFIFFLYYVFCLLYYIMIAFGHC